MRRMAKPDEPFGSRAVFFQQEILCFARPSHGGFAFFEACLAV
jgi:hypothetical protein